MAEKSEAHLVENGAELHAQIEALRREIGAITDVVGELVGPKARKRAAGAEKDLSDEARAALEDVEGYASRAAGAVRNTIRDRPVESTLLAFGIGVVVAKLLLDRRD